MRAHFFVCGTLTPSSRYRVLQFLPHLREAGVECALSAGYGRAYNRIAPTRLGLPYKLTCRAKRGLLEVLSANQSDVLFFQRKAFRELSVFEELAAQRNSRVIFDFDDSIFLSEDGQVHPMRQRSFERMCELSTHIICGNAWLAKRAGYPDKTTIIPTVIDTTRYTPGLPSAADRAAEGRPVTLGWMGTDSSFAFVRPLLPELRRVLAAHPEARLRLVSNATVAELEGHPQVEQIRWSPERELDLLRSFDVGIMPMIDNELTRGKCGFKMILYMAVGCPTVGSAVGANVEILGGSGAGVLVESDDGWGEALSRLIEAPERRHEMSAAAREHVVRRYSIRSVLAQYLQILGRVASAR